jgi:hypothetical protein
MPLPRDQLGHTLNRQYPRWQSEDLVTGDGMRQLCRERHTPSIQPWDPAEAVSTSVAVQARVSAEITLSNSSATSRHLAWQKA